MRTLASEGEEGGYGLGMRRTDDLAVDCYFGVEAFADTVMNWVRNLVGLFGAGLGIRWNCLALDGVFIG